MSSRTSRTTSQTTGRKVIHKRCLYCDGRGNLDDFGSPKPNGTPHTKKCYKCRSFGFGTTSKQKCPTCFGKHRGRTGNALKDPCPQQSRFCRANCHTCNGVGYVN